MKLVETHIVTKESPQWKFCDKLCFLSKNLYNYANYIIRQEFIESSKNKELGLVTHASWVRYNEIERRFKTENQVDYRALSIGSSQQTLMQLEKSWKSFFQSIKSYKKDPEKYNSKPSLPKYKDKIKGRNIVVFTLSQVCVLKNKGIINFPKTTNLKSIKTKVKPNELKQVRIIPSTYSYKIEVVYEKQEQNNENLNPTKYLSIDIGVDNLMTLTSNVSGLQPVIINGRTLKSINQYYNKKKAKLQSELQLQYPQRFVSNKINKLTLKRNNKIKTYLHSCSKYVIQYCIESNIKNIIIGYNDNWKQKVNLGSKTNQNFVDIPFKILINQVIYKGLLVGIVVKQREESYTSKCSALDLELISFHESYLGKRIKRGLFRTANDIEVNADVNGSLNILRKEIGNDFISLLNIGCVMQPTRLNL